MTVLLVFQNVLLTFFLQLSFSINLIMKFCITQITVMDLAEEENAAEEEAQKETDGITIESSKRFGIMHAKAFRNSMM